ncbi:sensor histidine kinase [Algoriphagus taiwanensis]|uniref:histidine kinase n=1 Tax=Algoriphagus taiwanensis TaxID=1445656 RepID=A0ABQ6Q2B0_9BACT|nr:ATP-binding protein [Algoriphagus taiwanensis]
MLSRDWIIAATFCYLGLLIALAWYTEREAAKGKSRSAHPWVYALSLAVYCTAWTYFGSVGRASTNGLEFLTIYIGPCLIAPLWWIVLRKTIRISKALKITSIADFISSRYGKSAHLGILVSIFCILGILPYISIQIKGIENSLEVLNLTEFSQSGTDFWNDTAFYVALGLAGFTIFFGTRNLDATLRHEGLVMAVTFESVFKLLAFLAIGIFITFFLFDGFGDLFTQASAAGLDRLFVLNGDAVSDWFWLGLLSMIAVMFLPRQFHMAVIENTSEKHIDTAMWLFPLYLILINVFVLPIALAGLLLFPSGTVNPDTFLLAIPMSKNAHGLALLGYLGGFAAATSMIIVSTISLSTMLSNNLIMPILVSNRRLQDQLRTQLPQILVWTRRSIILGIILLAYFYFRKLGNNATLVSTGLISFVAVAQLAPSLLGGIYWKSGSKLGAILGLWTGILLWFFTLILPILVQNGYWNPSVLSEGLFGISWLKPTSLFGMQGMSSITHSFFFSVFFNTLIYAGVSLLANRTSREHNQALIFVDIFKLGDNPDRSTIWRGQATQEALQNLLETFLGKKKAQKAMEKFFQSKGIPANERRWADPELVNYSQRLLSGHIGSASARIMIESIVNEEEISMDEVMGIVRETQELKNLNLELKAKSKALQKATENLQEANEALKISDMLKDEFISTVTHEMKTPITSIRAFSEILQDESIREEDKKRFLQIIIDETDRMTRLIDQVLDLERFDSGRQKLNFERVFLSEILESSLSSMAQVFSEKNIRLIPSLKLPESPLFLDEDRIKQVILNLLSNAAKFAKSEVRLSAYESEDQVIVEVVDDGPGIPEEDQPFVFDKFFQAKNQTSKKPIGSGLGLAISRKIAEYHGGRLGLESKKGKTRFWMEIPLETSIKVPQNQPIHE